MKVSHSAAAGWPNLVMSSPSRELGASVHIGPFDTCMHALGWRATNTKSQIEKQPSIVARWLLMVITEKGKPTPGSRPWKSIFKRSGREF
jgi:hypothetical protein